LIDSGECSIQLNRLAQHVEEEPSEEVNHISELEELVIKPHDNVAHEIVANPEAISHLSDVSGDC
jgi:hypothetical protein